MGGERQSVIAEKFGVGQGRVSPVWAGFRSRVYRLGGSAFSLNVRFSAQINILSRPDGSYEEMFLGDVGSQDGDPPA